MNKTIVLFLFLLTLTGGLRAGQTLSPYDISHGLFFSTGSSTRSRGMGFASVSLADDGSAIFINPAGLVTARGIIAYSDYTEGGSDYFISGARGSVIVPMNRVVAGAGLYRRGLEGGVSELLFRAGVGYMILEGAQGSFLSAGIDASFGRLSEKIDSDCAACGSVVESGSAGTAGIGMMLRPLPMISIGYSMDNLFRPDISLNGDEYAWKRKSRWGLSWILEDKVFLSWEREHYPGSTSDHFGISVKTSVPLELMAGFYEGRVTGGARFVSRRFNLAASFSPDEEDVVFASISLELYFRRKPDEISQ